MIVTIEYVYYETVEQRMFREWFASLPELTQKMWILTWANREEEFIYSMSGGSK